MQSVADKRAAGSLGRRVQQIVHQPLDGSEVRAALEALAQSFSEQQQQQQLSVETTGLGSLGKRRDVRTEMQDRRQQMDTEFVRALEQVNAAFGQVEASVERVDRECSGLRSQVNEALRATAGVASAAGLLVEERGELTTRLGLAREFLERFSLTEDEVARLAKGSVGDDQFFTMLDKVGRARAECQRLAGVSQTTAAADLQRELGLQEEAAYSELLRWVQSEARDLQRQDAPEFSSRLKQALGRLQPHGALFGAATDEIAKMRRESVARAFVGALVRGGPGGTPRPIEAHAADPQRYVGDMLAWAHQACASERELLDTLFSLAGGGDPPAAGGRGLDGQRSGDAKARLLATVLESVARPLEIRIRQTIDELDEPAAVYRVDGLLEFYCELFAVMCPVDSVFLSTARGLAVSARAKLASCLDALVEAAVNDVDVVGMRSSSSGGGLVSPALEVPASLRVLLTVVVNVLRLHEDSISQPRTGSGGVSAAVAPVGETVARVLERVHREMHAAIGQSDHDKYLRPYEQTMLKLNILNAMQDATMPFTDELCQWHSLGAEEERVLTEQLCAQLVEILKAKSHLPFGPASEQLVEEMGVDRLAVCWDRFNQTLKAATDLDLGRLTARLHSHVAARAVGAQAAQAFVAEYAALQSRVAAVVVAGGSEPGDALLAALHPPETVATLL